MRRRQSFATILVGKSILAPRRDLPEFCIRPIFASLPRYHASRICLHANSNTDRPLFLVVHTGDDFDAALEQIELFKDQHPGGRVAIVADHYRLVDLLSAFRAGANGYFVDVMTCDVFVKSLELVMMGETIFPPAFLSYVLGAETDHLSEAASWRHRSTKTATRSSLRRSTRSRRGFPRGRKSILRCLIEGDSNKCIARKIEIAEATVKVHVKAILRKIRVQNRTQAAIWGMNNGSLTQSTNNGSLLSTSDLTKQLPKSVEVSPEVKQIEASIAKARSSTKQTTSR